MKAAVEKYTRVPMSFQIEHEDVIVIVGEYDETEREIGIEDVVDPNTGEVLTEEWFEEGHIYDKELSEKIEERGREGAIEDQLDELL